MIILDFEVFKHDWMIYWLDTNEQQGYFIVNDRDKLIRFYNEYKDHIMIGYNINFYDKYIMQGILAGHDPYAISQWIIERQEPGWLFSQSMRDYPITTFDVMQPNKSLKQCEASLGMAIVESSVPFDIQRPLTQSEIEDTIGYCKADVYATFEVFLQDGFYLSPQSEFQSSIGIINEFGFPKWYMGKTKSQMGSAVLGAQNTNRDDSDEFDLISPTNLDLGEYEYVREWFMNPENHWYNRQLSGRSTPERNNFKTKIAGIEHIFAWGGVHGSVTREMIEGDLLLCDFSSLYPNIMVEYGLVSRGVPSPERYKELLETRIKLKNEGNDRQESYKIALNGSYGQMKYKGSPLYDPKMANNVCVHGQLILLDLIDKIEDYGQIINSNTDGVLIRVHTAENRQNVVEACAAVAERVRINIDIDEFAKIIIKDVNNYIAITEDGKIEAKGSYVKYKNPLEYNYNIISEAIREYFINGTPVEHTILRCNDLREFQIIAKSGNKYEYSMYGDKPLIEKVNRVFASKDENDKGIYKLHKVSGSKNKIEMTPERCFIINDDIRDMQIPIKLDRQWYITLAKRRVNEFVR